MGLRRDVGDVGDKMTARNLPASSLEPLGVTNKEISGLTMPPPTPESRGDSNLAAGDLGLNVD